MKPNSLPVITSVDVIRAFSDETLVKYHSGYYPNIVIPHIGRDAEMKEALIKRVLEAIGYRNLVDFTVQHE